MSTITEVRKALVEMLMDDDGTKIVQVSTDSRAVRGGERKKITVVWEETYDDDGQ